VLLAVAVLTFVLMSLVPGGPCNGERLPSKQAKTNCEEHYGLHDPLWQRLGTYLGNLAQGDLGESTFYQHRPVTQVISDRLAVSATLGLLALAVSVGLGIAIGVVCGLRQNSAVDYGGVALATLGASLPSFILGILLLYLFVGRLHWLPSGEWGSPKQAIMPVIALSALPAAYIARVTRASVLDALNEDYVRTARAKGVRERAVVLRHVLRNALLPVLTVVGPLAAYLVTGSFLVETLFSIGGIGLAFVEAIGGRDYDLIMGTTLLYATVIAVANLIVDLTYGVLDPRVRDGAGA
jgi:oligopeptide transport system permease protein